MNRKTLLTISFLGSLTLAFAQQTNYSDSELEEIAMATQNETLNRKTVQNEKQINLLADLIPTAGATETFTPTPDDFFYDPGGPGGSTAPDSPGNYPNCNCITTSTLQGITQLTFDTFEVFGSFDWVKIYDSSDLSGPVLYDSGPGGANEGDITLNDMITSAGSNTFTGTSGDITIEFRASLVINSEGFQISFGGDGGGDCEPAENFMVSNVQETTADFSWDEAIGDVVVYGVLVSLPEDIEDVIYQSEDLNPGTTTHTATGLTPDTAYVAFLITVCNNNDDPVQLSDTLNFTTTLLDVGSFETETFSMNPNPANNFVTVKANAAIEDILVYNILGQVVVQKTPNATEVTIDVSELQSGTYFVKAIVNGITTTEKLIKG